MLGRPPHRGKPTPGLAGTDLWLGDAAVVVLVVHFAGLGAAFLPARGQGGLRGPPFAGHVWRLRGGDGLPRTVKLVVSWEGVCPVDACLAHRPRCKGGLLATKRTTPPRPANPLQKPPAKIGIFWQTSEKSGIFWPKKKPGRLRGGGGMISGIPAPSKVFKDFLRD